VSDYLNSLPELNNLPFFVFMLHGTFTGTAGSIIRKNAHRAENASNIASKRISLLTKMTFRNGDETACSAFIAK
jgi:hypothetical protein